MDKFTAQIGNVSVTVKLGNLEQEKADAYVVPQFNSEASTDGVGGAVLRAGAEKGIQDYQDYVDQNGVQPFGKVVPTLSHGGNSKFLLHSVSVDSGKDKEFDTVALASYSMLKVAAEQGIIDTIASPALATGRFAYLSNEQSAKAMFSAAKKYAEEGGKALSLSIIIWPDSPDAKTAFDDFKKVLETGSYKNASSEVGGRELDYARLFSELAADGVLNARYEREQATNFKTKRPVAAPEKASFKRKPR